jgi:GH15 family glucan-1,4-alpha-glucosidase
VTLRSALNIRFEYGAIAGWASLRDGSASLELGPHHLALRASVPLGLDAGVVRAEFSLKAGEQEHFVLSYSASGRLPPIVDCEKALAETETHWLAWVERYTKATAWPDAVQRSLLTLGALVYRSTGGVVAAPTTSLPEQPGGDLNWDYRYCWLRDSTFTLCALLNAGLQKEAEAWLAWLVRAVGSDPTEMRIMYRVDGTRRIDEHQLPHLPGYRHARPVRIGNAASTQLQLDVFGELLDSFNIAKRAGIARSERLRSIEQAIVEHLAGVWHKPDQGMWESRGEPRHYVYSKVMCWVGIDRYLRNAGVDLDPACRNKFEGLRRTMHEEICAEGYHGGLGTFVDYYGAQAVDASLLMLPLVGFLPVEDQRIAATIARIERDLMPGGLVRRHPSRHEPPEGAFIACSFWLVDCWRMQGRDDAARALFERVLALANDLGLLSEEYNEAGRHLAGNFPQALSHVSLLNAALGLSGPVLQRAGG